jgi:WD40 repeat protein
MHTAGIVRIGIDAANRYLVTGSEDKTVRVWELASGRLLRALRPPTGAGNEGKIWSVRSLQTVRPSPLEGQQNAPGTHRTPSISLIGRVAGYSDASPACPMRYST